MTGVKLMITRLVRFPRVRKWYTYDNKGEGTVLHSPGEMRQGFFRREGGENRPTKPVASKLIEFIFVPSIHIEFWLAQCVSGG